MSVKTPPKLDVVVTFLEMTDAPNRPAAIVPPGKVAIVRAENPTLSFYHYLYNTVGEPWMWWSRRLMDDEELGTILARPETHVYVLYVAGVPAGYAELNLARMETDRVIDLAYMGLIPEFIGKGYGKYLLNWVVDTAWSLSPARLTVNTCSLDHSSALGAYQKAGFEVYDQRTEIIDDPRETGLIPKTVLTAGTRNSPKGNENTDPDTLIVDFPGRAR
ncbi:GNAT family N-acetyltransferase [Thalassospira sp.]|uniref:GNAT family N-acetyltransferase n=1 Tax=Thalassospira sp. TaxID=1912094 RepID=UPI0027353949|nr:GNAT family N-acetyltransferase [Thalassospira sp.]MDP2698198.1 GNAT family N-acetyltransferase [Thalassospira sp.]